MVVGGSSAEWTTPVPSVCCLYKLPSFWNLAVVRDGSCSWSTWVTAGFLLLSLVVLVFFVWLINSQKKDGNLCCLVAVLEPGCDNSNTLFTTTPLDLEAGKVSFYYTFTMVSVSPQKLVNHLLDFCFQEYLTELNFEDHMLAVVTLQCNPIIQFINISNYQHYLWS